MNFIYLYKIELRNLANALSGVGRGLRWRDDGGNINNVQHKSNWNCHYESPLYNEYILIKKKSQTSLLPYCVVEGSCKPTQIQKDGP
jgi:hypothetical protein